MKILFKYIEDYVLCLAGYPLSYNKLAPIKISLARYDVSILQSLSSQILSGSGFTDKQLKLVQRLVDKYTRQLSNNNIDIADQVLNPILKIPLRSVERSKTMHVTNDGIIIKFPFDDKIITELRVLRTKAIGKLKFLQDSKEWLAGFTDPLILALYQIAKKHNFDISQEFSDLAESVITVNELDYQIELCMGDSGLFIKNASDSLTQYIQDNCGGFSDSNILKLVDLSSVYGYTVSMEIQDIISSEYKHPEFFYHREVKTKDKLSIFEYAELTNRYPIYIYSHNSEFMMSEDITKYISKDQIHIGHPKKNIDKYKCIVTNGNRVSHTIGVIPLLITTNAMMISTGSLYLKQLAEKIVFHTDVVFHTVTK